jgi:hypothetical protein
LTDHAIRADEDVKKHNKKSFKQVSRSVLLMYAARLVQPFFTPRYGYRMASFHADPVGKPLKI